MTLGCGSSCPESQTARTPVGPGEQSYKQAVEVLCEVDHRASIGDEADPLEKSSLRADYINQHVKNPDGIEFRTLLSVKPPVDQARALREEAKDVGIERCALADSLVRE